MNIKQTLDAAIVAALEAVGAKDHPAVIKQAQKIEFGHYQANGVMAAAKQLRTNPRALAQNIVDRLALPQASKIEVAGPGFINIHLDSTYVAAELNKWHDNPRLGVEQQPSETIVIDYSAPNLAKEMHIGHLRSTTLGDTAARLLEFLGHQVIRANHVGDWGAQFGSLLAYLDQLAHTGVELTAELKDLEAFYQEASRLFKQDVDFASRARAYVVRLQSGDHRCRELWQMFINASVAHCQTVYDRLNISLTRQDIKAESAYNDDLPVVVAELEQLGLIEVSDGAKCVFLAAFKGQDDKPLPAIVEKSDGGYPYMTSDLAAVRYRTGQLGADEALYFIDARQTLHIAQVFAVAKAAGYLTAANRFRHLPFGMILKADGTPFKTRDGADVKLIDVIDEAIARALQRVTEKNPDLPAETQRQIAAVVGVGAIKYAELSKNRTTNYIFDWDAMLSFEGNTAPYLQYAYTRICSIFRRAGLNSRDLSNANINLITTAEMQLGVKLLQFAETLEAVIEDYQANLLCNYLFDLAGLFMSFYESYPILQAEDEVQTSRLILADLTARTLQQGLALLGIETVEQM